ncbi:MAG: hypothetical protein LC704_00515 [Actinobacteria bacterium]|nr:hypothetical protein [Actinomycetota bacterium]
MGSSALPIVLIFLLVLLTWQTIYSANRDLVRAKAWGDLARRALPFGALALMALSLFLVQTYRQGWVMITWMTVSGVLIVLASLLSIPALERRASRAFRRGDYQKAAELYGELAGERPTKAIRDDPEYGLAYYNRALVLQRMGKKSRAIKDLKKALETDLPRRFRSAVRKMLEENA